CRCAEGVRRAAFGMTGSARSEMGDAGYRKFAHDAIKQFGRHAPSGKEWSDFAEHLDYVAGEFSDKGAMDHLVEHLEGFDARVGKESGRFFYAATPQSVYPDIVDRLGATGLAG